MATHLERQGFTPVGEFRVAPDWETDRAEVLGAEHKFSRLKHTDVLD